MSIWNEIILPKINKISNTFVINFNDEFKEALETLDKFEEEFLNGRARARDKTAKGKDKNLTSTLQSIDEDEVEPTKPKDTQEPKSKRNSSSKTSPDNVASDTTIVSISSADSDGAQRSKKRSKNEVDGLLSPEQEKRQKRNASVKAQTIISKQKLRRDNSTEKDQSRSRRRNDDDKENDPVPLIQIKQEKISLPTESMDIEPLPDNIEVKTEAVMDDIAMPPPLMPVPRARRNVPKSYNEESTDDEASVTDKRRTRNKKQPENVPPQPVPRSRSTRSTRHTDVEDPAPVEVRPKRTRAKKKVSEVINTEVEKGVPLPLENGLAVSASPTEKPRPKRTRRGQKAADKLKEPEVPIQEPTIPEPTVQEPTVQEPTVQEPTVQEPTVQEPTVQEPTVPEPTVQEPVITPKEERISQPEVSVSSPILAQKVIKKPTKEKTKKKNAVEPVDEDAVPVVATEFEVPVVEKNQETNCMDQTMVLPNGVYNHAPTTPKNIRNMNETVVLEKTMVLEKKNKILDATVVIEKLPMERNVTDDNSIMTDDSDGIEPHTPRTPPLKEMPQPLPTSAVKEKVQQFEELASRVTRTKTRALAKKEDDTTENTTPPDKVSKVILSAETLNKMNNMIFNGKTQISSSASKPRTNVVPVKSLVTCSTSKLSALNKAKEAAEETLKREKEDARKKKEALLEAKRELQKRKREDKMAAAAAAREAAERERRQAVQAAARERMEKQAHADLGKIERMKELERKRMELARKAAETEERRRAEEAARQARLAEEQRRAEAARRRQVEEHDAMRKEEAKIAKEIEKKQKEYNEKKKMKHRLEDKMHTPLKTGNTGIGTGTGTASCGKIDPVYMADGFEYLNSDEDAEPANIPVPDWSTSRSRRQQLLLMSRVSSVHVDRLFSVRVHSPDLRDIFPGIARHHLKRTSSAVWRTPPGRGPLPVLTE